MFYNVLFGIILLLVENPSSEESSLFTAEVF